MSELIEEFQNTVYSSDPDYSTFCYLLRKRQKELTGIDLVRSHCLMRLGLALQQWLKTGEGSLDILVLLRQVIRSYQQRLILPSALWQRLSNGGSIAGLRTLPAFELDMLELTAEPWLPYWLSDTERIDLLERRRIDESVAGDGLLYAMTKGKFVYYQSHAQRVAVQSCFFTPPGSTLLVTLPTGAGKSMCILLPAWQASEGGQVKGGTTIVVVPTIALALDQERQARQYFDSAPTPEYEPHSWTSNTSAEARAEIRSGILHGTLPLLYVSPESLRQSELYTICLEAASRGTINRLVIDEAHLVETWGAGFRTDFQLLAAYQQQLLERSEGNLRTLLLSATVSHNCAILLEKLFAHGNQFYTVQANRLRSEPAYWFRFCWQDNTRDNYVLEALHYLPRPAILYVSTPESAERWKRRLQQHGFRRVAAFTGETKAQERQRLINAWDQNELDIMVATSAFGVGVDKSDVRTIVHACLPENVDRFYQEVGRSGRDGYSAISLVCTTVDDYGIAKNTNRTARITPEVAAPRWEGMRKSGIFPSTEHGDIQLVDTNAPPEDKPDMRRSEANHEWNVHTLLLMERAGLIEITHSREDVAASLEHDDKDDTDWLQIKLLQPSVTAYSESAAFRELLEVTRRKELDDIQSALRKMQQIIRDYGDDGLEDHQGRKSGRCIAYQFATLYPSCARACGGCKYCRQQKILPYEHPLPLEVDVELAEAQSPYLQGDLRGLMGWRSVMIVTWDGTHHLKMLPPLKHLLADLVWAGMQQIILPGELQERDWVEDIIKRLSKYTSVPHQLLFIDDLMKYRQLPLYALPSVIVYPTMDNEADEFYRHLQQYLQKWNSLRVPLIHVVHRALTLASEHGRFMDRIEGNTSDIDHLQRLLTQWQEA